MQHIQMQVSQKQKTFPRFLSAFSKSSLDFARFRTKDDSHSSDIYEITDSRKHG